MDSNKKAILKSAKTALTTAASVAASVMLARSLINEFLPSEIHNCLSSATNSLRARLSSQHTIVIEEMEGYSLNKMYDAVGTYLATKISSSMRRIRVSKVDGREKKSMTLSLEPGEELIDDFDGAQFKWQLLIHELHNGDGNGDGNGKAKERSYELSFNKKHRDKVLTTYLPYIEEAALLIQAGDRTLQLCTNDGDCWNPIDLHHPTTFDTLAMELERKQAVIDDLARFVKRKEYYRKIGKAWKRGYLLYGPPGTGKSSLIAAMANYLKFDIYDLELTEVKMNSTLRRLLVGTTSRSIIVVEDIDCSLEIKGREVKDDDKSGDDEKITLSGLLNFVDGLWSSTGEERIIVFTTNYKDRLDPALLRPGRMDMHIHMGYCDMTGFRVLASNYHDVNEHLLFEKIEGLIKEVKVTPAEVAEELMRSNDKGMALIGLIDLMEEKKKAKENGV